MNKITKAKLSDRERQVANMVARGFTTKQIAEKFGLTENTVQTHRKHICKKLGVRNTAGLVMLITTGHIKFSGGKKLLDEALGKKKLILLTKKYRQLSNEYDRLQSQYDELLKQKEVR